MERNPYTLSFGRIPAKYLSRDILIDEIIDEFNFGQEQAVKLTGIRGTGKTVALTDIEKRLRSDKKWIIVGVRSNGNIMEEIVSKLYSEVSFLTQYIDTNINLSLFGIGIGVEKSPVSSIASALTKIMTHLKKHQKKLLITIDEAQNTSFMRDFIQEFQILVRQEYPVYLVAAGLYEDIEEIENSDGMTFFLRASKYAMTPLNIRLIALDYKNTLRIDDKLAYQLASMTKGYAFAYQALGKFMWGHQELTEEIIIRFDEALAEKVYDKIWSELTEKDRWYLSFLVKKDSMPVSELLALTKKSHNDWSVPRKHLKEKGIIDTKERGMVKLILPRLDAYVSNLLML